MEEPVTAKKDISAVENIEIEEDVEVENIERPVDLYKVTSYL